MVVAGGQTRIVLGFTIAGGRIIGIDAIADPEQIRDLAVTILDGTQ